LQTAEGRQRQEAYVPVHEAFASVSTHLSTRSVQPRFLGRWTRDQLVAVLEHLYCNSGDLAWRSLAEATPRSLAPTTSPHL